VISSSLQIHPVTFCIHFSVLKRVIFTYFYPRLSVYSFPLSPHSFPQDICYQLSPIAVSPFSVTDGRIYGPSSCYKPISTTPTGRSRWNHLSNLSAAKLVAKWMTLHFVNKRATYISKSPQVNGILFKCVYKLILNTIHGKDRWCIQKFPDWGDTENTRLQINACKNCPRPPSCVQLGTLTH
jgi:hypothetical protein